MPQLPLPPPPPPPADGRVQVVLALQVAPFASLSAAASGDADIGAAVAAADAWAARVQGALAAYLATPVPSACAPLVEAQWVFGHVQATVCADHARSAASWLLQLPDVVSVGARGSMRAQDFHASAAVQGAQLSDPLTGSARSHLGLQPLWARGLTGAGQVGRARV